MNPDCVGTKCHDGYMCWAHRASYLEARNAVLQEELREDYNRLTIELDSVKGKLNLVSGELEHIRRISADVLSRVES